MTPAETLHAAATAIDGYLDVLPPLPWALDAPCEQDCTCEELYIADAAGIQHIGLNDDPSGQGLAKWLILSPTLLRMVGEYLEDLAGDAMEMPADMRAVAIAEVVLTALSGSAE